MKTYDVTVNWSGYSRGFSTYRVQADSEDEAKELWYEGEEVQRTTVRDDTEAQDFTSIEEVNQ